VKKNPWTENLNPQLGGVILREDGRQCMVEKFGYIMVRNPSQYSGNFRIGPVGAADLPPTAAGPRHLFPPVITYCKDTIPPRIVSSSVYWPTSIYDGKVTCDACLAKTPK
jgi:hypothetical protein